MAVVVGWLQMCGEGRGRVTRTFGTTQRGGRRHRRGGLIDTFRASCRVARALVGRVVDAVEVEPTGSAKNERCGSEGPVQDLERALKRVREYARRDTGGRHRSRAHLPTGRGRRARVRRRHESSIVPLRENISCDGRGNRAADSRSEFVCLHDAQVRTPDAPPAPFVAQDAARASEHDVAVAALIHKHGHVVLHFELRRAGQPLHSIDAVQLRAARSAQLDHKDWFAGSGELGVARFRITLGRVPCERDARE